MKKALEIVFSIFFLIDYKRIIILKEEILFNSFSLIINNIQSSSVVLVPRRHIRYLRMMNDDTTWTCICTCTYNE